MSELGVRLLPQLLLGGVAVVWGVDGYQQLSGASLALVNLALFHVLPALLLIGLARPVVRWRLKANPSHAANPGRAELAYTLVAWVIAALIVAWGVANYLNAIDVS